MLKAMDFSIGNAYSLDRKPSSSKKHFCMDLSTHEQCYDLERLRALSFTEISVDFVWMPTAYLSETVLSPSFYSTTLPFFSKILSDFGRIYLPATQTIFGRISKNWKQLSTLFILRYIREDQVEESTLYRATRSLPMMQLGKESAEKQVSHFGLTYEEAAKVCGNSQDLLVHHPKDILKIQFLCLIRLRRVNQTEHFEPFSEAYLHHSEKKRKSSKQVAALAKESIEYLSCSAIQIKSIRTQEKRGIPTFKSPFHAEYVDRNYGGNRTAKSKCKNQILSVPRFDPGSDAGFCLSDERRVAKNKEISEYGRVWTSRDTHLQNEQIYSTLSNLDARPLADDPTLMWSTVIAFRASEKMNRAVINKKFHLSKRKQLEDILSKTVISVKKREAQLVVVAFRLDWCPHAVMGRKAAHSFADLFGAKIVVLDNDRDHPFNPK
jgi:hypothetical protein